MTNTTINMETLIGFIADEISSIVVNKFDLTGEEFIFDSIIENRIAPKYISLFSQYAEDESEDEIIYNLGYISSVSEFIEESLKGINIDKLHTEIKSYL